MTGLAAIELHPGAVEPTAELLPGIAVGLEQLLTALQNPVGLAGESNAAQHPAAQGEQRGRLGGEAQVPRLLLSEGGVGLGALRLLHVVGHCGGETKGVDLLFIAVEEADGGLEFGHRLGGVTGGTQRPRLGEVQPAQSGRVEPRRVRVGGDRQGGEITGQGGIDAGAQCAVGQHRAGIGPARSGGEEAAHIGGIASLGGDGIGQGARQLGVAYR